MLESKELLLHGTTYTVFRDGTIIGPSGKVLKQRKDKDGYLYFVCNGGKSRFFTHRAVALCFVHNPDPSKRKEVDHLDNNRANPSAENLEWVTHGENVRRAAARGSYSGERNSRAILNKYEVIFIREANKLGITQRMLSEQMGVSKYTIADIMRGKTWKIIT